LGWKPAHLINELDYLIVNDSADCFNFVDSNIDRMDTTVSELFDSLVEAGDKPRTTSGVMNFHGDVFDSDVEIIDVSRSLVNGYEATVDTALQNCILKLSETAGSVLTDDGALDHFLFGSLNPSNGIVGGFSEFLDFVWACVFESDNICLSTRTDLEAELFKAKSYCGTPNSEHLAHFKDGDALIVEGLDFINDLFPSFQLNASYRVGDFVSSAIATIQNRRYFANAFPLIQELLTSYLSLLPTKMNCRLENVRFTSISHYDGHVYNVEDKKVFYSASGIINHNCRCSVVRVFEDL